jgi:hypothetical protein
MTLLLPMIINGVQIDSSNPQFAAQLLLERTRRSRLSFISAAVGGASLSVTFGEVLIMKVVSWFLILLPTTSFGAWLVYQHEPVASTLLGGLWLISTIFCLGWGLYIRHRYRVLAWVCGVVGLLHVGLLVLPAFGRAKMRAGIESTQPNHRAGVDAGCAFLFASGRPWPGTTRALSGSGHVTISWGKCQILRL